MSWGALSIVFESSDRIERPRKPYAEFTRVVQTHPSMRAGPPRQKWQTGGKPYRGGLVKYRLVTRCDFDGLVCAVLLRHLDMIDEITFAHPKDVQEGGGEGTQNE